MQKNRIPGVSFILRARNEEAYIQKSIECLKPLNIPYEIIVVLHKCTDKSKEIAENAKNKGQPIIIFEELQSLSRAGYENVVTPMDHPASFCNFTTNAFAHGKYNWFFKWDADFIASPELIQFLNNELVIDEKNPIRYKVPCIVGNNANEENYLLNCLIGYEKHVFWEVPCYAFNSIEIRILEAKIYTIPFTVLKTYWNEPRWFENGVDNKLEEKYQILVSLFGQEMVGGARAQCPDLDKAYLSIKQKKEKLESLGIYIFK